MYSFLVVWVKSLHRVCVSVWCFESTVVRIKVQMLGNHEPLEQIDIDWKSLCWTELKDWLYFYSTLYGQLYVDSRDSREVFLQSSKHIFVCCRFKKTWFAKVEERVGAIFMFIEDLSMQWFSVFLCTPYRWWEKDGGKESDSRYHQWLRPWPQPVAVDELQCYMQKNTTMHIVNANI